MAAGDGLSVLRGPARPWPVQGHAPSGGAPHGHEVPGGTDTRRRRQDRHHDAVGHPHAHALIRHEDGAGDLLGRQNDPPDGRQARLYAGDVHALRQERAHGLAVGQAGRDGTVQDALGEAPDGMVGDAGAVRRDV